LYHYKGVQEHILHLKDTENLHNIDSSTHNTGRMNESKMICNGHVSHRENNTHKIYIIDRSINQLINHFYRCMKKTDHILAIIPHEEETNTVSEAPVSSSQAELSYSQHCSYLLVDQGITH